MINTILYSNIETGGVHKVSLQNSAAARVVDLKVNLKGKSVPVKYSLKVPSIDLDVTNQES